MVILAQCLPSTAMAHMNSTKIILASKSVIRQQLLANTGLKFTTVSANIDEQVIKTQFKGGDFSALALELANAKVQIISQQNPQAIIIGCDQLCVIDTRLMNKPKTIDNAIEQLQFLNGKQHSLISAVAIWQHNAQQWHTVETALMTMKTLSTEQIIDYVNQDKPLHSCGSYYYELNGKNLFSAIKGNEDTILGLPLKELTNFLKTLYPDI